MSNNTRKAVLNAKHEIELKSIDEMDAIQTRYKETVATAKKTRKEEITGVKLKERNDLRDAVLKINAEAEQVREQAHKAAVDRLKGSANVTGSSDTNGTDKNVPTPVTGKTGTTGTTGGTVKGAGKVNDRTDNVKEA